MYGNASDYVLAKHHDAILRRFPAARLTGIDGAGHWVHAEKPEHVVTAVHSMLDEIGD